VEAYVLNNVRHEASRHFRNRKKECVKDKIKELAKNSKNKNNRNLYRVINELKSGYQPRSNLVKDENDYLIADSHNILNRWKNYFSQSLNVHTASDVGQIEIHTAVLGPCPFEGEIAVARIQEGGESLWSEIHKIINSVWKKEQLPDQ
jgi:hypothetical protein